MIEKAINSSVRSSVKYARPYCRCSGDLTSTIVLIVGLIFGFIQPTVSATNSSSYFGSLTRSSSSYARPDDYYNPNYYYQAIQVNVSLDGTYVFKSNSSMDIYGYFYDNFVDPSDPSTNLIASDRDSSGYGQFRITVDLKHEQIYVLLVTTYGPYVTGDFSINAFGEGSINFISIMPSTSRPFPTTTRYIPQRVTTYDGYVSRNSPILLSPPNLPPGYHHYEVVKVTTLFSGVFTFNSSCDIYIVGYFYNGTFDPDNLLHNMFQSDSSSYGVLRFYISMEPEKSYFLVITTYNPDVELGFLITAVGPYQIYMTSSTPSTSRPPPTTTTLPIVSANYSGYFLLDSPVFFPFDRSDLYWYYQAIQVVVGTTSTYTFYGTSREIRLCAYLYYNSFDPSNPSQNLYDYYKYELGWTFRLDDTLQAGQTYVLVVAAYYPENIGSFSLTLSGLLSIDITPITPSTSKPIRTTVVTPPTDTTIYSGSLSTNNPIFSPFSRPTGDYYYQAYKMFNTDWGRYSFTSSSHLHTCGYLYINDFDLSNTSKNLFSYNNGSYEPEQFQIVDTLDTFKHYVLIVTTFNSQMTGKFSLLVNGRKPLELIPFIPTMPTTIRTTSTTSQAIVHTTTANPQTWNMSTIVGISVGGFLLTLAIIGGIFIYRKYQRNTNATLVSPVINPYVTTNVDQNINSITRKHAHNVKQLPPDYHTFASGSKA